MRQFILLLLLCMGLFDNLFGQSSEEDYLLGVFTGAEGKFTITVSRRPDLVYEGTIVVEGKEYPYEGFRLLGMLSGQYEYNGVATSFSLARHEGQYSFTTEGQSLQVIRVSTEPTKTPPKSNSSGASFSMSAKPPANQTFGPATGGLVKDPYGTYTVNLPAGWSGKEENGAIIAVKSGDKVQLTASAHGYSSVAAIKASVEPVIQDESRGIYLEAKVSDFGTNGVNITYEGAVNGEVYQIEVVALISPHGGGVTLAAAGTTNPPAFTESHANYLKSMAASVKWTKPTPGAESTKWQTALSGKLLTYLSTGGGGSEKVDLHLCANGTYFRKYEGSYASGGYADFSSVSADKSAGTWRISTRGAQTVLLLSDSMGNLQEYTLATRSASNEVSLNGNRYFINGNANCN